MRRWLTALAPWVGLGVLLWREQTLERGIAAFVESANRLLQEHVMDVTVQARDAVEEAAAQRGGSPVRPVWGE